MFSRFPKYGFRSCFLTRPIFSINPTPAIRLMCSPYPHSALVFAVGARKPVFRNRICLLPPAQHPHSMVGVFWSNLRSENGFRGSDRCFGP